MEPELYLWLVLQACFAGLFYRLVLQFKVRLEDKVVAKPSVFERTEFS